MFFFFQAEDGIRDLVRSRGLGDVYKRQGKLTFNPWLDREGTPQVSADLLLQDFQFVGDAEPVSYTHLTLPTSDLV